MEEDLDQILNKGNEVFETINCITLYEHHNEILFYTWGESRCCLPEGTTHATIRNDNGKFNLFLFNWNDVPGKDSTMLKHFLEERFAFDWMDDLEFEKIDEGGSNEKIFATDEVHHISIELWQERMQAVLMLEGRVHYKFTVMREGEIGDLKVYDLTLKTGDCLLFEEVDSPLQFLSSGGLKQNKIDFPLPTSPSPPALANPMHRHVVRLIETESKIDDLNGTPVIDITWDKEDALPFALCLWDFPQPITVARGNIVLADHGRTIRECLEDRYVCRKFQPRLQIKPLTHRGPLDPNSPASSVFRYEMQEVVPDIYIEEYDSNISDCKNIGKDRDPITWHAVTDLLSSERFRREFVIEVENDDTAQIRFGDNIMGLIPEPSTQKILELCVLFTEWETARRVM